MWGAGVGCREGVQAGGSDVLQEWVQSWGTGLGHRVGLQCWEPEGWNVDLGCSDGVQT